MESRVLQPAAHEDTAPTDRTQYPLILTVPANVTPHVQYMSRHTICAVPPVQAWPRIVPSFVAQPLS